MEGYAKCASVVNAHGIKGELKAFGDAEILKSVKSVLIEGEKSERKLINARPHKNCIILKLAGISDMNEAERFKGKDIYVKRDEVTLPEDVYFIEDVLGLSVFDRNGNAYGKITEIRTVGSTDVYTATDENGVERMFPAISECDIKISLEEKTLIFTPLEGLFD